MPVAKKVRMASCGVQTMLIWTNEYQNGTFSPIVDLHAGLTLVPPINSSALILKEFLVPVSKETER